MKSNCVSRIDVGDMCRKKCRDHVIDCCICVFESVHHMCFTSIFGTCFLFSLAQTSYAKISITMLSLPLARVGERVKDVVGEGCGG